MKFGDSGRKNDPGRAGDAAGGDGRSRAGGGVRTRMIRVTSSVPFSWSCHTGKGSKGGAGGVEPLTSAFTEPRARPLHYMPHLEQRLEVRDQRTDKKNCSSLHCPLTS